MNVKAQIQVELEEIDAEFNRPGSTMLMNVWQQRRGELVARLDDAERAARIEALKNPPQPKGVSSKPKPVYRMADSARAELEDFDEKRKAAFEAGDIDALVALSGDRRLRELMAETALEKESEFSERNNIRTLWFCYEQSILLNEIRVAQLRTTKKRLDDLSARLEALEAKPEINYRGVFNERECYNRRDFCTWDGSMWYCKRDGVSVPPSYNHDGSSPWQLAVKKGSPGKDGR